MITDDQEDKINEAFGEFIMKLEAIEELNPATRTGDVALLALKSFHVAMMSTIKDKKLAIEISRQMHEDTLARVLTDGLGDATRH